MKDEERRGGGTKRKMEKEKWQYWELPNIFACCNWDNKNKDQTKVFFIVCMAWVSHTVVCISENRCKSKRHSLFPDRCNGSRHIRQCSQENKAYEWYW